MCTSIVVSAVVLSCLNTPFAVCTQDRRIAHMPYHALTPDERETYAARRDMLAHLGHLFRQQAVEFEIRHRANDPRVCEFRPYIVMYKCRQKYTFLTRHFTL